MKTLKNLPFLKLSWWTEDGYFRFNMLLFPILCSFVVFLSGILFGKFDFAPTTESDFAPLYEQKNIILADSSSLYGMNNVTITISEKEVRYVLTSTRCSLSFLQNKETKEVSDVTEISNTDGIGTVLGISVLAIAAGFILALIISAFIAAYHPYRLIKNKMKTIFS